jgi:hypothetical protein
MEKLLASLEGQDNRTSHPSKDRRQRERLQLFLPVHLKPIDSNDPLEEEVTNTMNFSRTGLCFTTLLTHYYEGMLVAVTVPYSSTALASKNYRGKIVRLDHLSNGCMAVAVQFLS